MSDVLSNLWSGITDSASETWKKLPKGAKVAVAGGGALLAAKALAPKNMLMTSALMRLGRGQNDDDTERGVNFNGAQALTTASLYAGNEDVSVPVNPDSIIYFPLDASVRALRLGEALQRGSAFFPWSTLPVISGDPTAELRAPVIFVDSVGNLVSDPGLYVWRLPNPLQGGLFKKIGSAIKKVATKVIAPVAKVAASFIPGLGPIASKVIDAGAKLIADSGSKPSAPPVPAPAPVPAEIVATNKALASSLQPVLGPGAATVASMANALASTIQGAKAQVKADVDASPGAASLVNSLQPSLPAVVEKPQAAIDLETTPVGLTGVTAYARQPAPDPRVARGVELAETAATAEDDPGVMLASDREIQEPTVSSKGIVLADPRTTIDQELLAGFVPLVPAIAAIGKWLVQILSLAWPFIRKALLNKAVIARIVTMSRTVAVKAGTTSIAVIKFAGPKAAIGAAAVFYFVRKGNKKQQDDLAAIITRYLDGESNDRWRRLYEHDIRKAFTIFSRREQEEASELIAEAVFNCAAQASVPTASDQVKKDYTALLDLVDAMKAQNPKTYNTLEKSANDAMALVMDSAINAGSSGPVPTAADLTFESSDPLLSEKEAASLPISDTAGEEVADADKPKVWGQISDLLVKVGIPVALAANAAILFKHLAKQEADSGESDTGDNSEGDSASKGQRFIPMSL